MTRVVSGAVLLIFAVAVVWLAPPLIVLAVAELLLVLGCVEYVRLAAAGGVEVPFAPATFAAAVTAIGVTAGILDIMIVTVFIALAGVTMARWRGEDDVLARVAAALLPSLYLGVPVGVMASIHALYGRERLFLMMLTVFVSDTAQYYSGRQFGRTALAPAISPKKTVEGAIGGFVCGALIMVIVGVWWLPGVAVGFRALLGVAIVALGIAGDPFESMLKRSAGVKDSSSIIPGHGGVLDRIDALLFAAPVYYIILRYA